MTTSTRDFRATRRRDPSWAEPAPGQPPALEARDLRDRADHLPVLLPLLRARRGQHARDRWQSHHRNRPDRAALFPGPGDFLVRALRRGRTPPAGPADRLPGSPRLDPLDNRRDAHPVADAHRAQPVKRILSLYL